MLVEEITRLGEKRNDGKVWYVICTFNSIPVCYHCTRPNLVPSFTILLPCSVKFVKLIDDERCGNLFEAIIGTLKAARKAKVVDFEGEFLLKGVHDDTIITVM